MDEPTVQPDAPLDKREHLLVFLHTMTDTPLTWQDQVGALPDGWRPLTPWVRGLKPTDTESFDLQSAADALSTIPLEHGVDKLAVLGDGLGAAVALRAAADSPDMIGGLILVNPLLGPPPGFGMQKTALKMTSRSRLAAQNIDKDRLMATLEMVGSLDLGEAPEQVHCPVLVIAPEGLPRSAAAHLATFTERLRVAHTVHLPGNPPLHHTNPEAFMEAVQTFLKVVEDERLA